MNSTNVESILETILSGKTGNSSKFTEGVYGMEGSRIPRQKVQDLLEEIIGSTGRFTMKSSGLESGANKTDRFNVKGLSEEELKELVTKLLSSKEGSGFNTPFLGSPSSGHPAQYHYLNVLTLSKIHLMNMNELKQFIRMWIKQLTIEVVNKEWTGMALSEQQQPIVDKHLVKKVLVKFIDLIEHNCDKSVDRQAIMDVLRQIDVFEVTEQAVYESKVLNKVCGTSGQKPSGGEDMTDLLITLIKEVLKRRDVGGFSGYRQRMDQPTFEFGSRKNISQLIDVLLNEEGPSRYGGASSWGKRGSRDTNKDDLVDELMKSLGHGNKSGERYPPQMGDEESSPILSMLMNKLRKSDMTGSRGNLWNEDVASHKTGRIDRILDELLASQRYGGSARYGQRSSESVHPKVEELIEMLRRC